MKSVFGSYTDISPYQRTSSQEEDILMDVITRVTKENGLIAHKPFIDKTLQLYQLSQVNHGKCVQWQCLVAVSPIGIFIFITRRYY